MRILNITPRLVGFKNNVKAGSIRWCGESWVPFPLLLMQLRIFWIGVLNRGVGCEAHMNKNSNPTWSFEALETPNSDQLLSICDAIGSNVIPWTSNLIQANLRIILFHAFGCRIFQVWFIRIHMHSGGVSFVTWGYQVEFWIWIQYKIDTHRGRGTSPE